jgi:hypothetical protein
MICTLKRVGIDNVVNARRSEGNLLDGSKKPKRSSRGGWIVVRLEEPKYISLTNEIMRMYLVTLDLRADPAHG